MVTRFQDEAIRMLRGGSPAHAACQSPWFVWQLLHTSCSYPAKPAPTAIMRAMKNSQAFKSARGYTLLIFIEMRFPYALSAIADRR